MHVVLLSVLLLPGVDPPPMGLEEQPTVIVEGYDFYSGNNRHLFRPVFPYYYCRWACNYRRIYYQCHAYNYRQLYDYPWHANSYECSLTIPAISGESDSRRRLGGRRLQGTTVGVE